jgi:diaminohydroxyphosphoribosylaminopyrimidine deaminase/5-amino-6-(5-phosphoribosylamino)uracil reductase
VTAGATNPAWPAGTEVLALPDGAGRVDLPRMLTELAARDVNELHVEAGAKLNGALLAAGLLDELLLYVAPAILGDPARGAFERVAPLPSLDTRANLLIDTIDRVGDDVRIVAGFARKDG